MQWLSRKGRTVSVKRRSRSSAAINGREIRKMTTRADMAVCFEGGGFNLTPGDRWLQHAQSEFASRLWREELGAHRGRRFGENARRLQPPISGVDPASQ